MSRSGNLPKIAAEIEHAHSTASHAAYRSHLDARRQLACDVAFMLREDASETARWLRDRRPAAGRVGWLTRLFLSLRLASHGVLASESVLEAAKATIRAAAVHEELLTHERAARDAAHSGRSSSSRYKRGDT